MIPRAALILLPACVLLAVLLAGVLHGAGILDVMR